MVSKNLVLGFLFLFNFNIGKFDILPDFVAYLLIINGLSKIENRHKEYKNAKNLAKILFLVVTISLSSSYYEIFPVNGLVKLIISHSINILRIFMVYNLCRGIYLDGVMLKDEGLKVDATHRMYLYTFTELLCMNLLLLSKLEQLIYFVTVFVIVSLLAMIELVSRVPDDIQKIDCLNRIGDNNENMS